IRTRPLPSHIPHSRPIPSVDCMDRAALGSNKSLKVFFQNIFGMRTKSRMVLLNSSVCDFDVIVLVETWLNSIFSSSEFFEPKLFQVFRKDRDSSSTHCKRGGGVIIAIRRSMLATVVGLKVGDPILDQLAISIQGIQGPF
ncbi:hypothetical protein KR067_002683, partial [Drosophila pandora]